MTMTITTWGIIAEKLEGKARSFAGYPPATISSWSEWTLEQEQTQKLLMSLEWNFPHRQTWRRLAGMVELTCVFTDRRTEKDCAVWS
ncbi:MAG: hypothetical protein Ct9H300mP28_34960 [Pseudomonadota bacterium]|nr:MAG: hypothetical protein Ct9H300mP28_34960 [Pseudomonadota bacterium]